MSRATWPTPRCASAACWSTRAGRASAAATSRFTPTRSIAQTLLDHFDIIGWDPRGTGLSEPAIDCVDDYDHYFADTDITPDDDAESQQLIDLAQEFTDTCVNKNADLLPYVGTNNSARDMNAIREALGEPKISYFGFSYGSELGATWATLFPDTVRAAVLDGASDPDADFVESGLQQAARLRGQHRDVPCKVQRQHCLRVQQRRGR